MHISAPSQSDKGFTLIELMVVVGIIGILVAIAAPNFARYQSKARQSEAKIALSAIFGGEKSFYSEYSAYVTSFAASGFAPEGQKRFYTTGFGGTLTTSITGYSGGVTLPTYSRTNFPSTWTTCTPTVALGSGDSATDPQDFTAAASGQIRDATACDLWTIDDNKLLKNVTISL